jgi:hypothetical protein
MCKKILWLIMLITMIQVVSALDMCTDTREINTNCTMMTPAMNCTTYDYEIINASSGAVVENNNLTLLYDDIYQFNFTVGEGDYVIKLCDDTTREVRVTEEDNNRMIIFGIILLPMILGFFFLIGAATMGKDHSALRIVLFLLSIPTFFISAYFGMVGLVKYYNFPELQNAIAFSIYIIGTVFFVLLLYFITYVFYKAIKTAAKAKAEELEYD